MYDKSIYSNWRICTKLATMCFIQLASVMSFLQKKSVMSFFIHVLSHIIIGLKERTESHTLNIHYLQIFELRIVFFFFATLKCFGVWKKKKQGGLKLETEAIIKHEDIVWSWLGLFHAFWVSACINTKTVSTSSGIVSGANMCFQGE